MCPADDDPARVDVFDTEGRPLASEVVRGYDSADTLADHIEAI